MNLNFDKFRIFLEQYAKPRWENQTEKWSLRPGGGEAYFHDRILPKASPFLTEKKLQDDIKNSLVAVMNAHVNLLSRFEFSETKEFINGADENQLRSQFFKLLFGGENLKERLDSFLTWTKVKKIPGENKKIGVNATSCSYFLSLSNPNEYPFCKPSAYKEAVRTLLDGSALVKDPVDRIVHCRLLYKDVLNLLTNEYGLKNGNLLDVHSLFYCKQAEGGKEKQEVSYWQLAPGDGAKLWDNFRENSLAAVGWDDIDRSLEGVPIKQLEDIFHNTYPNANERQTKVGTKQLWNFVNLKPQDKIVINKGKSKLLALGEVTSGYKYRPERTEYKHTVDVNYFSIINDGVDIPGHLKGKFGRTILNLGKSAYQEIGKLFVNGDKPISHKNLYKTSHPLNLILYGPPGTGKTYQTVNYALAILEDKTLDQIQSEENELGRSELIKRFNSYNNEGQIEFITFHQNYAYEDFIQGLRPKPDDRDKTLSFELKDGVFKRIADIALENFKASGLRNESGSTKPPFKKAFDSFFSTLRSGETEEVEIKMKKVSYHITEISDKSIYFVKHSGGTGHTLCINTLSEMYEQEKCTMTAGLRAYYMPLLDKLLKHAYSMSIESSREDLKNYVLIIDEINRANISRVFGELITLIEDDKRYGQINEMKVTLPSGELLCVPSNLFIIGTMNTADKSIALLDIALRRRFEFKKVFPDAGLVEAPYKELLNEINALMVEQKGADYQLGHAYFMPKNGNGLNVKEVFDNKIIPLLYEYFMNDGDAVEKVLTAAGVNASKNQGLYEFGSFSDEQ
jgi:hypothetical protein